ncbi:hypothetical protein ACFF45_35040, partial [Streptomyces cinereospinus]
VDAPGRALSCDAGLVRIAAGRTAAARRPRPVRPVRLGLAAALAVVLVGGVAVAAGTGVLGTSLRDDEPGPAASASAVEPPERPLVPSPPPRAGQPGPATPDGRVPDGPGSSGDGAPAAGGDTEETAGAAGAGRRTVTRACRDLRAGKDLDAGRERALGEVAGGSPRVRAYCDALLGGVGGPDDRDGDKDTNRDEAKDKAEAEEKDKAEDKDKAEAEEKDRGESGDKGDGAEDGRDGGGGTAPGLTGGSRSGTSS